MCKRDVELIDFGDAYVATKQLMPGGPYVDSIYVHGWKLLD
jgi:hypothetical protein